MDPLSKDPFSEPDCISETLIEAWLKHERAAVSSSIVVRFPGNNRPELHNLPQLHREGPKGSPQKGYP